MKTIYNPEGTQNVTLTPGDVCIIVSTSEFGPLMQGDAYPSWGKMITPTPRRGFSMQGKAAPVIRGTVFPGYPADQRFGDLQIGVSLKANNFSTEPKAKKATSLETRIEREKAKLAKLEQERAEWDKLATERGIKATTQPVATPTSAPQKAGK